MSRSEGPFDRLLRSRRQRDPAAFIIGGTVLFIALVILIVFALSSFLSGDGGGEAQRDQSSGIQTRRGEMPPLPPGLAALSDFVFFDADGDVSATIGLPVRSVSEETSGIGFYTYEDERWQRVAEGQLAQDGKRAEAALSPVPDNLAVLRVVAQAYQVAGSLPPGGTLHPDASVGIVSPRDYKPQSDGSIGGSATDVQPGEDVLLIPTIVGSGEESAPLVNDILADDSLRQQHVSEITSLVESGDFAGIDLEYSSVDSERREEFTSFVEDLASALHDNSRRLSLTLPPPSEQREAYDWPALGKAADIIKVLPVADPVDYWDAMPKGLDELVRDVDPSKVMLAVSPFSIELADNEARPLGYLEALVRASEVRIREPEDVTTIKTDTGVRFVAVNLAESEGATSLRWSDDAAAIFYSYGAPDKRTVYIENVYSVAFKLEIVQTYGLGGVSVSDASAQRDVANIWPAVNQLVDSGTVSLVRPNGDSLVPRWEAPDGGQLDAAAGASVVWRADESGTYKLRLLVSDGDRRFGREISVDVKSGDEATPFVTFPAEEPTPTPTPTPTPVPTEEPAPTPTPGDVTAPGKVTGVTIDDSVPGQFTISWNPSAASDLEVYRIYASSAGPDADFPTEFDEVGDGVLAGTNTYVDDEFTLPDNVGTTYYYIIVAIDKSGNESKPSNVKSAVLQ